VLLAKGKASSVNFIEAHFEMILITYEFMDLNSWDAAFYIEVYLTHNLCIHKYASITGHVIDVHLKRVSVVHHHLGHTFVDTTFGLIPKSNVHRTVVSLIFFE